MSISIQGNFEVKLQPADTVFNQDGLDRMSIDKKLTGSLIGQSRGEMITARTCLETSAGYAAAEKFSGTLEGKAGSFILQHFAVMSTGENRLILEIVPDSGTEALKGISGKMEIERADVGHQYVLHCAPD